MNAKTIKYKGTVAVALLLIINSTASLEAQAELKGGSNYPVVNNKCPEFTLTNVTHYPKNQVTLPDFQGKWLILDFFSKGCASCFASLPKLNELQSEFSNEMQFLLVGKNDKHGKDIQAIYEKFRHKQNLRLAVAYDTALFEQFGVRAVPHIVIVDPDGIVRAVTHTVKKEDIVKLLNNNPASFNRKYNEYESSQVQKVDTTKPLLIDGNGGESTDFLFRSLLAQWSPGTPQLINTRIDSQLNVGIFQGTGITLQWLYNLAYIGTGSWSFHDSLYHEISRFPVLEIGDSLAFKSDFHTGAGIYNYSLIVPPEKASKKYFMEVMQRDLKSYFGYNVSIEKRYVPCWKLVASDSAVSKLKTKGGNKRFIGNPSAIGFSCVNFSITDILAMIYSYHQLQPRFIDATKIAVNVDISIDAVMTDLSDIKAALKKNGLDLVKDKVEMRVLVFYSEESH